MKNRGLAKELLFLFLFLCVGVIGVNTADGYFLKTPGESISPPQREVIFRNSKENYGISDEVENILAQYFKVWFDSMAELNEDDVNRFFAASDKNGAISGAIDQTALSFLISIREKQDNDLRMEGYVCGITYVSAETLNNGDIRIVLDEDNQCYFAFIPDVLSSSAGIRHVFTLRKMEDGLRMISHEKEEDGYILISEQCDQEKRQTMDINQIREMLTATKENYLKMADADIQKLGTQKALMNNGQVEKSSLKASGVYNRQAAVDYAMKWTDEVSVIRNEAWNHYDEYDGNCNNFISQCLNAGGIPMDFEGNALWKYFDDEVDLSEAPVGRSSSWAGVEEFFEYSKENTGSGLVSEVAANIYTGEIGDVLQYGVGNNWKHSVIITDVIVDQDGKIKDYLINSNTTDRINYPASAYAYSNLRLIKVLGYNPVSE